MLIVDSYRRPRIQNPYRRPHIRNLLCGGPSVGPPHRMLTGPHFLPAEDPLMHTTTRFPGSYREQRCDTPVPNIGSFSSEKMRDVPKVQGSSPVKRSFLRPRITIIGCAPSVSGQYGL